MDNVSPMFFFGVILLGFYALIIYAGREIIMVIWALIVMLFIGAMLVSFAYQFLLWLF